MPRVVPVRGLTALVLLCGLTMTVQAEVKLPAIFSDHMVLQCDKALPVWGWADPGEQVTVTLAGQSKTASACEKGRWSVKLDAVKAGGPLVLKVQGKNSIQVNDVLVGEVWLCSGQSNMAMTVGGCFDLEREVASANYPQIRQFFTNRKAVPEPQDNCTGQWLVCSPKTVAGFSGTAFFFGRELHKQLNVPVGLINSSVGGTPIQAWTALKAQAAVPQLAPLVENYKKAVVSYNPAAAQKRYEKQLADWEQAAAKAKNAGTPFRGRKPQPPLQPDLSPHSPATLFNGMIAPLAPYAITGALWYQGESNAGAARLYGTQLRTMIANWRSLWQQGDFSFLFVQLPNFMAPQTKPVEPGGWPTLREEFLKALAVPGTGMAVTIDIGDAKDIHPRNKQDVGKRLAQWALAKAYGKNVVACGPLYKSMRKEGDRIILQFDHGGAGLVPHGGSPLRGFAIAGEDKKFVAAQATIQGDEVIVSSPEVKAPAAVRYAWANNPDVNLANKEGLPASPFRTDNWDD